ncbi:hypothetical protein SISNIDRAFT_454383 [Sistotremastrum niveocremeum HHB9708]|uniref:1,3-beta-glucanosyltransferase n=1 Tax=Sistotremastrum niveocremeum HHB9708 TaxID=1314777 RepID=A0A164UHI9_9AGAM|nr:hypothetical protein SISNIDRAFT_454383 [Sistotremastrum niveocremeum HHB9708]
MRSLSTYSLLCLLFVASVFSLDTITRAGRYLYNSTDGSRFYIKGVAYQEEGTLGSDAANSLPEPTDFIDPLADAPSCQRDLPNLKTLGVNAVRVYSVNASLNHDACVQSLADAGIYLIIDLSQPVNGSLNRDFPAWTTNLLDLYIENINAFLNYSNVLAFNVGNEVVTSPAETVAAPFIKAAARDIKAYLRSKNSTALVGYSSIDGDQSWRGPLANFLSCDSDADSLDIFGLNNYEYCSTATYSNSGYPSLVQDFTNYNIPFYFSEFGCNVEPRLFTEVASIFGPNMTGVFSGGVAFGYFQATVPGFNLVNISSDGSTATPNSDFNNLQQQFANVTFNNTPSESSAGSTSFPSCPQPNAAFLASTTLPPTPNDELCACVANSSFSCVFTPQTTNTTAIIGELIGIACGLLANQGSNCDVISASGSSGTYGELSFCDPGTQLSWAMTAFYELNGRNPASCSFSGNATINTAGPSSSAAAEAAANSCLAAAPTGTFTPTAASSVPPVTAAATSSTSSSSSGSKNAGFSKSHQPAELIALSVVTIVAALGGFWTVF